MIVYILTRKKYRQMRNRRRVGRGHVSSEPMDIHSGCVRCAFVRRCGGSPGTPTPGVAPVPPAILNAKRVSISNAGSDSGLFPHPFNGDPDRPYNQFYSTIQGWGRYELVAGPAEADIVFELQLTALTVPQTQTSRRARQTHFRCSGWLSSIGKRAMCSGH